MANMNGKGPRTPKIDDINRALTFVQSLEDNDEAENVYCILDWALTYLDNRRLYHKRMQLKQKIAMRLLKESFNGDLKDLESQAGAIAEKELFDHVANQPPDTSADTSADAEGGE